jgi:hypothetical protein
LVQGTVSALLRKDQNSYVNPTKQGKHKIKIKEGKTKEFLEEINLIRKECQHMHLVKEACVSISMVVVINKDYPSKNSLKNNKIKTS